MTRNRPLLIGGVLATLAAWGCWQMMEAVPDYSPPSTAYYYSGNALIVVALVLFFLGLTRRS